MDRESRSCNVNGFSVRELVNGAVAWKVCSLPVLLAVVQAAFVVTIVGRILVNKLRSPRGHSFTTSTVQPRGALHRFAEWFCAVLCAVHGVLFLGTGWEWYHDNLKDFPAGNLAVIGVQGVGWTLMVVVFGLERSEGRALYPGALQLWWIVGLFVSVPATWIGFSQGWDGPISQGLVCATSFGFLALSTANALGLLYGDFCAQSELEEPLLKESVKEKEVLPGLGDAGVLSFLTTSWLWPLLVRGGRHPLQLHDLPQLPVGDDGFANFTEFHALWKLENSSNSKKASSGLPSLWWALCKCYWRSYLGTFSLTLIWCATFFTGPVMVFQITTFLNSEHRSVTRGLVLVVIMLFGKTLECASRHLSVFLFTKLGLRMWAAVGFSVYHKALRLSNKAKQDWTVGEITNVLSADTQRLLQVNNAIAQCLVLPLQISIATAFLYSVLGISVIAGLSTLIVVFGINVFLASLMRSFRMDYLKAKDERMKSTVECMSNMKLIKLQSWDELCTRKIEALREIERVGVARFMFASSVSLFVIWAAPSTVSVVTFCLMALLGEPFTVAKVFTAVTTFSVIKESVQSFPDNISVVIQSLVSFQRIRKFLCEREIVESAVGKVSDPSSTEFAVDIQDASFSWEVEKESVAVRDLSLKVRKGSCIAVCGSVGSGKSSLLYSIMGELERRTGSAKLCGSIAYVAQSAWIQTRSIRDNILFGRTMEPTRYREAVRACGLEADFAQLPHGDETEIGERGINLSGGQKQRIQLARAVYADADVYLLDDPFSAVDAHTASHLSQECVRGVLKNKTVILVSHQVEFLQGTDQILVMKDGAVVESGSYDELVHVGREFGAFVDALHLSLESVKQVQVDAVPTKAITPSSGKRNNQPNSTTQIGSVNISGSSSKNTVVERDELIKKEVRETGRVKSAVAWTYATMLNRGVFLFVLMFLNVATYAFQVGADSWLAGGAGNGGYLNYVGMYSLLVAGGLLAVLLRATTSAYWGVATAQIFFLKMFRSIMRAPMSFFDSTPLGRILSRCSSDQTSLELELPNAFSLATFSCVGVVGTVLVAGYVTPPILFLVIPIGLVSFMLQTRFISSAREISRLIQITEAPLFLHVGESVAGAMTIRVFGEQDRFMHVNSERFEAYQSCCFHFGAAVSWYAMRIQSAVAVVISCVALLLILLPADALAPGLAGLALTYALGLNSVIGSIAYNMSTVENKLISVERIAQYWDLPSEAPLVIEDNRPSPQWPEVGQIELEDLKIRYRPNTPLVLKGISCTMRAREKVGVVGRTGSGKSTLVQALFRLIEPAGGRIIIDGVDISTLGLADLRSRLSVIPQEPTIFEGTLRSNLDPFNKYSDLEIWETLEKCLLAEVVRNKPEKLEASVTQLGENWSVGQRQLLCLGRALLKRARILVLDEATASVDITTDGLIQHTIRQYFADCTVISVAHRIPSVIDSDRVLVLDAGFLVENDSPQNLLSDMNSLFSKLVDEYTHRVAMQEN